MTNANRPLIEPVSTRLQPVELFEFFRDERFCFLLDSGMDPGKLGRYSFMGNNPFLLMRTRGNRTTLTQETGKTVIYGNPFDVLGRYLEKYRLEPGDDAPVPFVSGAVGYLSYDLCHRIERLPQTAGDDLKLPEMYFGFYDLILAYDHLLGKTYLISSGFPETDEAKRRRRAQARLDALKIKLTGAPPVNNAGVHIPEAGNTSFKGNFTHESYVAAVQRARQYIIDGDIFEVNLSQRFEAELHIPPYKLYTRLRGINPAPFAAYLSFDDLKIISASPERFLKVSGDKIETRPIKGTIKRGRTPAEDKIQAQTLLNSAKDRAENMMIVDLERNDLGRVCRYGTVKVTELEILETYPTVFHLTSTVTGQLRPEKNNTHLLKATFPGGSITGAPKIRSMEIIDELEPTRRSVYTGSLGYFSFDGNIDINIVIRTFIIKGNKAYFQVGGAVVYDSDPEGEYEETLLKAKALIQSLTMGNTK